MKIRSHGLFVLICVLSALRIAGFGEKTFIATRSQGLNVARQMVGMSMLEHRYEVDLNYGVFSTTFEYNHSFNARKTADALFGGCRLRFTGSRVPSRAQTDVLADYFGLPADFNSTVTFKPIVRNFIADLTWHQSLDRWLPGCYICIDMPITHTDWDLGLQECVAEAGEAFHPAGYLGMDRIEREDLAVNVTHALRGDVVFGDKRSPNRYGKIVDRVNETQIADFNVTLGADFFYHPRGFVGIFMRLTVPTGTRPSAEFLFEPLVGGLKHWEFGGGLNGRVTLWQAAEHHHEIGLSIDTYFGYVAPAKQRRSFDLNIGNGSRYLLLEQINPPSPILLADGEPTSSQYQGRLIPAVELTSLRTVITVGFQTDLAAMLTYRHRHFSLDMGYNAWVRSAEHLRCRETFPNGYFAVKGDAMIYGFTADDTPVALSATESRATIYAGTGNTNFDNSTVDNPAEASSTTGALLNLNIQDANDLNITPVAPQTSAPPVMLSDAHINECSALLPQAVSHTFFVHAQYTWDCKSTLIPFIGGGSSAQWAQGSGAGVSALSQWALWGKMGIAF